MTYRDNAYILSKLKERYPDYYQRAKAQYETFEYSDEEERIIDMIDHIVNAHSIDHPLMEKPRG